MLKQQITAQLWLCQAGNARCLQIPLPSPAPVLFFPLAQPGRVTFVPSKAKLDKVTSPSQLGTICVRVHGHTCAQRVVKAKQCPNEHLASAKEGLKLPKPHFVLSPVAPHVVVANCS